MLIWSNIQTCYRRWRRYLWTPRGRLYLCISFCRGLEFLWYTSWLYLGFVAALQGFLVKKISVEPTIIALCVAMILTVQNIRTNQLVSICTGILGLLIAVLTLAKSAGVEAWNRDFWMLVGLLIGVSAFSIGGLALPVMPFWRTWRRQRRRQKNRKRRQRNP